MGLSRAWAYLRLLGLRCRVELIRDAVVLILESLALTLLPELEIVLVCGLPLRLEGLLAEISGLALVLDTGRVVVVVACSFLMSGDLIVQLDGPLFVCRELRLQVF